MRIVAVLLAMPLVAAEYAAPAGIRAALRRPGAATILPGGRIIASLGTQHVTGPGPFGLAVSPDGKILVTANVGPDRYSLTVLERSRTLPWVVRHLVASGGSEDRQRDRWNSVFMGLAFSGNDRVFASEGNSGRVRLVDLESGRARKIYNLNQDGYTDSYTGDLAFDAERGLLYVIDQANFRLVAIDTRRDVVVSSVRLGRLPFSIALSPDRRKAYVTNVGMFEYRAVPGVDPGRVTTGLPFPAFGFPSDEARDGARRSTATGPVDVPGLGDPNAREANSVCVVDLGDPAAPAVEAWIRTGLPVGGGTHGGCSPSGILAAAGRVFVSNAHNDSITVIDPATNRVAGEIPIRIPGLEHLRGVLPIGLAYHEPTGWLLVEGDTVAVTNARGQGIGPNVGRDPEEGPFSGTLRRGTVSVFTLPLAGDLAAHTRFVMEANGFVPRKEKAGPLPADVRHVVLIVKESRSFDEVLGDIQEASNGKVVGFPPLARFGRRGYAAGHLRRLSIKDADVTPNHHLMAERWAFSDNFYADSEFSLDGHHWLTGAYPNGWVESSRRTAYGGQKDFRFPTAAPGRLSFPGTNSSVHPEGLPEAGTIWHHFERHGISFRNFGEGFELAGMVEAGEGEPAGARYLTNVPMPDPLYRNTSRTYPGYNMNIPDQYRAGQFIREIQERYVEGGQEFPRFIFIHLPNDHMALPRPEDGYPYEASYVADNDYALGRILELLSGTPWWRRMVVFVTEDAAEDGRDHIDAHRTVLLAAGPWCKRNYVSHVNTSFPGLLKTIFRILGVPPLNLFDAAASDLSDCFTMEPDFSPYAVQPVDPRIFDPAKARAPRAPKPEAPGEQRRPRD